MGQDPSEIRQEVEQTRAQMGETVEALAYRADVKERAKESASEKLESMKGKASGSASRARGKAKDRANRLSSTAQENPLGVAAGGVAIGVLAGLVVPSSRVEQEKLGPVGDELRQQAAKTSQEALERGKQVAQQAAQAATETAKEEAQKHGQELAEDAKQSGQEARSRIGS